MVCYTVIAVAIVVAILLFAVFLYYRSRFNTWLLHQILIRYDVHLEKLKREHLNQLSDIKPRKTGGQLRVMDLGCGTGLNLKYFPAHCEVIGVDPGDEYRQQYYNKARDSVTANISNYVQAFAEDLSMIEDGSINVVVTMLVFCEISDAQKSLKEIMRVLVPGGKFIWWEHVLDKPGTFRGAIQNFWPVRKTWEVIIDGCHINRNTAAEIKRAGFSSVEETHFLLPTSTYTHASILFWLMGSHSKGVAVN